MQKLREDPHFISKVFKKGSRGTDVIYEFCALLSESFIKHAVIYIYLFQICGTIHDNFSTLNLEIDRHTCVPEFTKLFCKFRVGVSYSFFYISN